MSPVMLNHVPSAAKRIRPPYVLNMIVRDEAHVIRRCLESLRPLLDPAADSWCIVDTGSTDGTQALVREALSWLPGHLHTRPWTDFGTARTEALRHVPGRDGYAFFLDADEVATFPAGALDLPFLYQDAYALPFDLEGIRFPRLAFASLKVDWTWRGPIHEQLVYPDGRPAVPVLLDCGMTVRSFEDGGRHANPDRHASDLALVSSMEDEPRRLFYTAQTHMVARRYAEAAKAFLERAECETGWEEERKYSYLQLAKIAMVIEGQTVLDVVTTSLDAYIQAPERAGEILGLLADYLMAQGQPQLAYLFASVAMAQGDPGNGFLVERDWYERKSKLVFALAAQELGRSAEAAAVFGQLERAGLWPVAGRIA